MDCAKGEYSTLGSAVCVACKDGEYADTTASSACVSCLAGSMCPTKIAITQCGAGEER